MSFDIPNGSSSENMNVTVSEVVWSYPKVAGVYSGVVYEVEKFKGTFGDAIRLTYVIKDGQDAYTVPDYVPFHDVLMPGSKLYKRLTAILKGETLTGSQVNLADLEGHAVRVTLIPVLKDGKQYLRVGDVEGV